MIKYDKKRFQELVQNTITLNTVNIVQGVYLKGLNSGSTSDEILLQDGLPKDFALLSIDIDGANYHIWDELDL